MKKLRHFILLAALSTVIGQVHAQDGLTNGLVAYYPFNGNANDASGNGNHGTLHNVTFEARSGQQAALFDGSSSYVSIPHNDSFNLVSQCTVAVWVDDRTPVGQYRSIVSKENNSNFVPHFKFQIDTAGSLNFYVSNGASVGSRQSGGWKHYVGVSDQSGLRLYLNGLLESSLLLESNDLAPNQSDLTIGRLSHFEPRAPQGNPWMYFLGKIDEVRIYNRALSSADVAQLYAHESFCSPHSAQATATLTAGYVTGATILDNGCGYSAPPSVRIIGGGGTGATAVALVSAGTVTNVVITNAGTGYTTPPRILIESPPFVPQVVKISVSRVNVTQKTQINHNYILEISRDLVTWQAVGPQFTAESELITTEHDVSVGERYFFRLREVP